MKIYWISIINDINESISTSFIIEVMDVQISEKFKMLAIVNYNWSGYIQNHLDAFKCRMNLKGYKDVIKCMAFLMTFRIRLAFVTEL